MGKKLYVGNLPFSVNSEKLKEIFAASASVEEAQVISFKDTGKSKGFGFVTVADDQAEKAKQELNGKEIEGRKIFVNDATPFDANAPRKPRRSFNDGGFRRNDGYGRGGGGGFRRRDNRDNDSDE